LQRKSHVCFLCFLAWSFRIWAKRVLEFHSDGNVAFRTGWPVPDRTLSISLCLLSKYLVNRNVPLALILLGPVVVNILLYHLLLNHAGAALAIVVTMGNPGLSLSSVLLWPGCAADFLEKHSLALRFYKNSG
jgi:hypothetical protein